MSTADKQQEQRMKKIYNYILLSRDSTEKKKGVRTLSSYGKNRYHLYKNFVT